VADKHIDLVPRRQPDLIPRGRDYLIYADDRRVGRIYEVFTRPPQQEHWFWGLQGVFTSMEIGELHGAAQSYEEAQTKLRAAFKTWLAWALTAPETHLSYTQVRKDLVGVGAQ
jgi:hypothetical protein